MRRSTPASRNYAQAFGIASQSSLKAEELSMAKRKHAEAIQPEEIDRKKSKKPRTHREKPIRDDPTFPAEHNLKNPPQQATTSIGFDHRKAARKHAKKLARQQRRDERKDTDRRKDTDKRKDKKALKDQDGPLLRHQQDDSYAETHKDSTKTDEAISQLPKTLDSSKKKKRQPKGKSRSKKTASHDQSDQSWTLSEPCGGRMLDLDPVFSPNEEWGFSPYFGSLGC